MKIVNTTAYKTEDLEALVELCAKRKPKNANPDVEAIIFRYSRRGPLKFGLHAFHNWSSTNNCSHILLQRPQYLGINPLMALAGAADGSLPIAPKKMIEELSELILRSFGTSLWTGGYYNSRFKKAKVYMKIRNTRVRYTQRPSKGNKERRIIANALTELYQAKQQLISRYDDQESLDDEIEWTKESLESLRRDKQKGEKDIIVHKKKIKKLEKSFAKLEEKLG
jgi:hypothetical protein